MHLSKSDYKMNRLKFLLIALISYINISFAQVENDNVSSRDFFEWNVGFALGPEVRLPGTSVLWGRTIITDKNVIFEYEGGLAFPTVLTAKFGFGKRIKKTNLIAGIRPYPINFYIQASTISTERGYWIFSVEYNPFPGDNLITFGSRAIFNVGYRWHR